MAYEAVPDDIELQKLTAPERDALSRYKIHENINTFLANENVPVVIGGLIAAYLGVRLADAIIADLEARLGKLGVDIEQGIRDTVDINLRLPGAPGEGITLSEFIKQAPGVFRAKYL